MTIIADKIQKLKILFLHPNFPAQFKHLAESIASENHEVKFLCQTHYGREIVGVEKLTLKKKASKEYLDSKNLSLFDRAQSLANQYRMAFINLKHNNYEPDVVICHSGWGCGLYVKEVWSNTKLISYFEWWFDPKSDFFHYDISNKDLGLNPDCTKKSWARNQTVAMELVTSSCIVAPTQWQRNQLPNKLQENCLVIFDGIDLNKFKPKTNTAQINKKITYGTRGFDPMRCFPQFIKEIPLLVEKLPNVSIEIAGQDEAFYGNSKPKDTGFNTWGVWAKQYLKGKDVMNNVSFIGYLDTKRYIDWLNSSDCHIYLSHPFVMSWSLVESYCMGMPIVTSDIEATREICRDADDVVFVDHRKPGAISTGIIKILNSDSSHRSDKLIKQRRVSRFSRDLSLDLWEALWLV